MCVWDDACDVCVWELLWEEHSLSRASKRFNISTQTQYEMAEKRQDG